MIGVIVVAVILYPRPTVAVPLPSYLDRCVTNVVYHYHPGLSISVNGTSFTIPPDVGRSGSCNRPLHTHPPGSNPSAPFSDGEIHVESDENRDYTLGDFFLIWGNWANDPKMTIFSSTQLFTNHVDATHHLTVTVNGQPNTEFQNLVLPKTADPTANPFAIVITYQAGTTY